MRLRVWWGGAMEEAIQKTHAKYAKKLGTPENSSVPIEIFGISRGSEITIE